MDDLTKQAPPPAAEAMPISHTMATPLNVFLFAILMILVYIRLKPKTPQTLQKPPAPVVFQTFTPKTLLPFSGKNNTPVYLAVRGKVFDVTPGRNFYGPGGPYANFAGRDASRGLAFGSFDEDMLTVDLEGPIDDLADLNEEQKEALKGWEERFDEKYLVVGRLVPFGSVEALKAQAAGDEKAS